MARQLADMEAMNLYQLIGAPLLAVVQAEVQAAQASAEFIRRVGFETGGGPPSAITPLQEGGTLGELKMANFALQKTMADGSAQVHNIQIPVLSMFPIPLLQVKDAEFDFAVKIVSRQPVDSVDTSRDVATSGPESESKPAPVPEDFLASGRVELKGSLARGAGEGERSSQMHMRVKIRMEQADLPVGLTRFFGLMDQAVSVAPREEK